MGDAVDDESLQDPLDKDLFAAIPSRHTNFSSFSDKGVEDELITKLKQAAAKEGAWLHICNEYERMAITSLIVEGDHIQMSDKRFRRELASWLDPRRRLSRDGFPQDEFDFKKFLSSYQTCFMRRFEMEDRAIVSDDRLNDEIPVLAILGCNSGGMNERIYAGQAFARVLLRAEAEGLAVSTLNQPCEVPELRLRLHDEIEQSGRAQMIMRIGYGGKPTKTPRRSLKSVLEIDGKEQTTKTVMHQIERDDQLNDNVFDRFKRLFVAK
jgi:hypothetical protein